MFTVAEARRALPYVARILGDAYEAYHAARRARLALDCAESSEEQRHACAMRDAALNRLNHTIDECNSVGLAYVDIPTGLAAFRAQVRGRSVSLLWRLDEPIIDRWAELDRRHARRHAPA